MDQLMVVITDYLRDPEVARTLFELLIATASVVGLASFIVVMAFVDDRGKINQLKVKNKKLLASEIRANTKALDANHQLLASLLERLEQEGFNQRLRESIHRAALDEEARELESEVACSHARSEFRD